MKVREMKVPKTKRALATIAGLLALAVFVPFTGANADGTETLGPPSIPIATGTGIATGGVGLDAGQPAPLEVSVPAGATVEQVILYWEGRHFAPDITGDNTITVNGIEVVGQTIGSTFVGFTALGEPGYSTSFRADITGLGLVEPGPNTLIVGGLTFNQFNDGAGIVVIYDDGSAPATIQVRDGNDFAYHKLPGSLSTTTPQTFTVAASTSSRDAELNLQVGNVDTARPTIIRVTVGGVVTDYENLLGSLDGPQWDSVVIPLTIPAGVTTVTVQILSAGSPGDPASFAWVSATLAVAPAQTVVPTGKCKITYGGRITAANGDKATFGGNAQGNGGSPKGSQEYQDHGPAVDINVHSIDVRSVTCSADGTAGTITGTATINGSGTFNYTIDVQDLGEPGSGDTYRIRLSNGYDSGQQVLFGGNIQIHV